MATGDSSANVAKAGFATTRWSMVLTAVRGNSSGDRAALESLCAAYWYPLYAFARRLGQSSDEAADATQEFFANLVEKPFLESADPLRGRFRTFLLTVFKRFLARQHAREQTQKRGGGLRFASIHASAGEEKYRFEPADQWTPELLYQRRWALTLLDQAMHRLRQEFSDKKKAAVWEHCHVFLDQHETPSYAELSQRMEMNETAVRVAVHRLRQRYRELLRVVVAETVDDPGDVDDELRFLLRALRGE